MICSGNHKRILLVGAWRYDIYEKALACGLEEAGCEVIAFSTKDYIPSSSWPPKSWLAYIQNKLLAGPYVIRLNRELLHLALRCQPDIVFLHKPIFVWPRTIKQLKKSINSIVMTYNNDNPFAYGKWTLWRYYLKTISLCDINFFYRPSNFEQAKMMGIPSPRILLPYYIEGSHLPVRNIPDELRHDVVFVGHYEPDGRAEILEYLFDHGVRVRVYGTRWEELPICSVIRQQDIYPVYGEDYTRVIAGAKIALVFLSKHNVDSYNRRCFEIPACETLLMTPDNSDLRKLFTENREAVFYSSKEELLHKIKFYLNNPWQRQKIATGGYYRVRGDQHSNMRRAKEILSFVSNFD